MNRETDQESLRRTLWRIVAVISFLGAVSYGALTHFVAGEIADPQATVRVGVDYSTFHAAAQILRVGEASDLYDAQAVAAIRSNLRGEAVPATAAYVNPPAFAMLLVPFAGMRYEVGSRSGRCWGWWRWDSRSWSCVHHDRGLSSLSRQHQ